MTASVFEPPSHPLPYTPPSYWHDMRTSIDEAIARGQAGPCAKSKRVAWVQSTRGSYKPIFGVNAPALPSVGCTGDAACKAVCGQLCNHAEENAVVDLLQSGRSVLDEGFDVFHLEIVAGVPAPFDREGKPKRPSCITCARLIQIAGARAVWLFGVDGWRWWSARDFWLETAAEVGVITPERLAVHHRPNARSA